jgi:exosome complex component RRP42
MAGVVISDAEKKFIVDGVQQDFRLDGRARHDYRCAASATAGIEALLRHRSSLSYPLTSSHAVPPRRSQLTVECGLLPQADGSARVTLVNGNTEILAAVKVELGEPEPGKAEGSIECSVECWATAAPLRSSSTAELNAQLSAALQRCVAGGRSGSASVRNEALREPSDR